MKKHYQRFFDQIKPDQELIHHMKEGKVTAISMHLLIACICMLLFVSSIYYLQLREGKQAISQVDSDTGSLIVYEDDLMLEVVNDYFAQDNQLVVDVAGFEETRLSEANAAIKGKVVASSKIQNDHETYYEYKVEIEKVYFADRKIKKGTTITIRVNTYEYTSLYGSVYGLFKNRTYLLILNDDKQHENYRLLYPFVPQIQVTKDNGYLFYADEILEYGYLSLMNDKSKSIVCKSKDCLFPMKIRYDNAFEKDFNKLLKRFKQ